LIVIEARWEFELGRRRDRNINIPDIDKKRNVVILMRKWRGLGDGGAGVLHWEGDGTVSIRDNRVKCILSIYTVVCVVSWRIKVRCDR